MEITRAEISAAAASATPADNPSTQTPLELRGSEVLVKALQAEGVRVAHAPYPEQHKFALYREAQWWHHAPQIVDHLPGCEQVNRTSIRLPLITGAADELIAQYAAAFEKVWAHREKLQG